VYVTDGGFPFQMQALAGLVGRLTVVFPEVGGSEMPEGGMPIPADNVAYEPLPWRGGARRKVAILWNHLRNLGRYRRLLQQADAVHCPVPSHVSMVPMVLALLMRKPLLVRYCGDFRRPKTLVQRWLVALMKATARRRCVSYLATGLDDQPPHPHIPWIFATSLHETDLNAPLLPAPDPPLMAWVGRLDANKGVDTLLHLISQAAAAGKPWKWLVVGDGLMRDRMAAAAAHFPLLEWHAYLPHAALMARLRSASLLLFTSRSEGFPKVILEAMAAGLPIAAFPISPLPALQKEGARIFQLPEDAQDQLSLIQAVLESPEMPEYRRRNRAIARRFSLDAWQAELQKAIERLSQRCPTASSE